MINFSIEGIQTNWWIVLFKYVQLSQNVVLILLNQNVLPESIIYLLHNFLTLRGNTSLFTAKNLHMAFVQLHNPATLPQTYNKTKINYIDWDMVRFHTRTG